MFVARRANTLSIQRRRQFWPPDKPFKILSLDGGGIKGLYSARFLALCEMHFARNSSVADFFDLIAGTSTGGIIALGLGHHISMEHIYSFYEDDGKYVFPPRSDIWIRRKLDCLLHTTRMKLDHKQLEKHLRYRFGERRFGESHSRLVIPAFMMPKTEIAVFKTDHHEDYRNDYRSFTWEVARATSAAPTYLKGYEHDDNGRIFLDGGVWANNPIMLGVVEALSAYDLNLSQIHVLSLGTGNPAFALKRRAVFGGLFAWRQIIKAAMFLTTDNFTAQAKLLLGPERCLRCEPTGADAEVELDDYESAIGSLPGVAEEDFFANRDLIERFFSEKARPRERHYT